MLVIFEKDATKKELPKEKIESKKTATKKVPIVTEIKMVTQDSKNKPIPSKQINLKQIK